MTEEELNITQPDAPEAEVEIPAALPGDEGFTGDTAELLRKLAEKDQAYNELENQMRRLAADFDNFRRRQAQERENLIKFAGERILERLLDVMDNFERALEAGKKATEPQQVLTGVDMIYRQVQDFMAKEGVTMLDAVGQPFDPNQHEAVFQAEADDVPDQTVLEVFRKGYILNGRVLRHAMVKVASNPSIPAVPPTSNSDSAEQTAQTDSAHQS